MPGAVMRDYRGEHAIVLGGRTVSDGKCDVHLDDTFLLISGARTNRIGYEQVESIRQVGRSVEIQLHPDGRVHLGGMDGALVRPLFLHLSRLRGLRWATLLRFFEGEPLDALECTVQRDGGPPQEALVRLYRTGLVGMPYGGEPFQLGIHELQKVAVSPDYRLVCATPETTAVLFGCEPGDLGRFHRAIEGARQAAEKETAALLEELFPALEYASLVALTGLLLRGRAASKAELEAAVPWIWGRIEERIRSNASTGRSYAYLRERAGNDMWFGLRRLTEAEMREAEGSTEEMPAEAPIIPEPGSAAAEARKDYLFWFMAGLKASGKRFLAMEVVAGTKGFATYVYRCPEVGEDSAVFADTARVVSRSMVALNFHREPIYAAQEDIDAGRFAEYKLAVRKLPYLRAVRERFVGRAIHTTPEAWQRNLEGLLV